MIEAAVVGAWIWRGRVLRLLLRHPNVKLRQAVSETYSGKR